MGSHQPEDEEQDNAPGTSNAAAEEEQQHGLKRQRTNDEELRASRAAKRRRAGAAAAGSPEPERPTDEPPKRYGVPTPLRASQLDVRGKSTPPLRGDDKEGHYCYVLGENLTKRYKILNKMGEGTFGRVLECWDRSTKRYVAIKVVRNVPKYREAAMIELEVLHTLERHDPPGSKHCVQLKSWFDFRSHVCMVFERLGPSLYDFLRRNGYRPFSAAVTREIGQQLLEAVAYMHGLGLVHTDLKPENVLLVSGEYDRAAAPCDARVGRRVPLSSAIRVIDFGSATYDDQYHSTIVSTRHYRAPEVILGLGWSYPCDIWSIGCILAELLSGDALFQTHDNLEHLAMMERVLGAPIPEGMAARAKAAGAGRYFQRNLRLNWPDGADSRKSARCVRHLPGLRDTLRERADAALRPYMRDALDLLHKLLAYEPGDRLTAAEALQHPFFTGAARTPASPPSAAPASGDAKGEEGEGESGGAKGGSGGGNEGAGSDAASADAAAGEEGEEEKERAASASDGAEGGSAEAAAAADDDDVSAAAGAAAEAAAAEGAATLVAASKGGGSTAAALLPGEAEATDTAAAAADAATDGKEQ